MAGGEVWFIGAAGTGNVTVVAGGGGGAGCQRLTWCCRLSTDFCSEASVTFRSLSSVERPGAVGSDMGMGVGVGVGGMRYGLRYGRLLISLRNLLKDVARSPLLSGKSRSNAGSAFKTLTRSNSMWCRAVREGFAELVEFGGREGFSVGVRGEFEAGILNPSVFSG